MTGSNNKNIVEKSAEKELTCREICGDLLKPAREELGARIVALGGGEFLLRKDAIEIVREAAALEYTTISVLTNGCIIDDDLLKTLKQAAGRKLVITFGINSIGDKKINRVTRETEPDMVVKALELCRRNRIRRHVVVNVGRYNMHTLETTFSWLTKKRIPFNRSPFVPRNSGREYFEEMGFSKEDMQRFIHPALRKQLSCYVSYTPLFLAPEVHAEVSGGNSWNVTVPHDPCIGCWVGSWIAVSAEGNVAPCTTLLDELSAGNIRDSSLTEIVATSGIFRNILNRDALKGKCGRCRYKRTCGGCRAMAYYHCSDYMAEDPTCFFDPVDESTVSEFEEKTNAMFRKYARLARISGLS